MCLLRLKINIQQNKSENIFWQMGRGWGIGLCRLSGPQLKQFETRAPSRVPFPPLLARRVNGPRPSRPCTGRYGLDERKRILSTWPQTQGPLLLRGLCFCLDLLISVLIKPLLVASERDPNLLTLFTKENFFCHIIRGGKNKKTKQAWLPAKLDLAFKRYRQQFGFLPSALPSLCVGSIPKASPLWSPGGQTVTAGWQFYLVFPPSNLSKNGKSLLSSRGISVV